MRATRQRLTLTLLGGGLATTALWAILPASKATPQPESPPLAVRAASPRADVESGAESSSFAASLHYEREARLAFRVPGRIASFPARIGDQMARGATLAVIEAAPYAAAAQRASADYDRASRSAQRYAALVREGSASGAQASDGQDAARAAEAGLAAARYDLQSTRLTMPFTGAVIARQGEQGETVGAGQGVLTVADTRSPLLASAQVPVGTALGLHSGQSATLALPDGQTLPVRVLRKAAAADGRSGLVTVDLALPAHARALSGSPASVSFTRAAAPATGLRIPVEALLAAQGTTASVFVIDSKGRARRRAVQLLGLVDREARITGLSASARVITMGAGFVRDGQRVEVTP